MFIIRGSPILSLSKMGHPFRLFDSIAVVVIVVVVTIVVDVVVVIVSCDILPGLWQSFRIGRRGTLGTARGLPSEFLRLLLSSCLSIRCGCRCGSRRRSFCSHCHSGSCWHLGSLVLQIIVAVVVIITAVTVIAAVVIGHRHWQHEALLRISNDVALHSSSLTG